MPTATSELLGAQIIEVLREKPGQTAQQVARKLAREREEVNRLLHGPLKNRLRQDRSYRWFLSDCSPALDSGSGKGEDTELARLCRYYLACLGYDDTGVAAFLTSKSGDVDYEELEILPLAPSALADNPAALQMLGRKRTDRGRHALFLGYPSAISRRASRRSDWQGLMVEPLLLFPVDQEPYTGRLLLDLAFPMVNQTPLRAFTNAEREGLINELVQLEQELGLGQDGGPVLVDELALRLRAIRPEWPWKEDVEPESLAVASGPIAGVHEPGIYNRAILILAEKSRYTQGLEQELHDLAKLPQDRYRNTALGRWIRHDENTASASTTERPAPLLEVLPMNSEQRQAVRAALTRPLTLITGPPGTGKSQVVTNLLVNAAWSGKRILFASKNNKAVDVVETRVNALGSRPVLLRVGAQAYQARLAEYVLALLSVTTTPAEREEFDAARRTHDGLLQEHEELETQAQRLVDLRNEVDRLEQQAEDSRHRLGHGRFTTAIDVSTATILSATALILRAADRADRNKAFFARLFWRFIRRSRLDALAKAMLAAAPRFAKVGVALPPASAAESVLDAVRESCEAVRGTLADIEIAAAYRRRLQELQRMEPLEVVARKEADLLKRIARHSAQLWKLWLRLRPSRLSSSERRNLGRYTSLLKMVIEAGENGQLAASARGQYRKLLKEVSHLLPCWAVTSLSARGRIPFEPGIFDIIVFDEASQCDIASALPLLFRAQAVVVIGDAKQLAHISGLQRGQDQALMEKHGLIADFAEWAYSHQSLFDLGSTRASGDDVMSLVDHHRSHADIISFSNTEFYEGRLRVATRYDRLNSPNPGEPGIRWIDVKGRAVRPPAGGALNRAEADAAIEALRGLVLGKGYTGTVGLVTPFRAQANKITEAVNRDDRLSRALIKADFLADTVHKFQGDERDVMFFSPVVASECPAGALEFLRRNPNLFNVAITRARAQLIVVGDRVACSQSDVGYLSRFAEYAATLDHVKELDLEEWPLHLGPVYPPVARPELVSDWEKPFYGALYEAGLRPIPQYPVEKYLLDFLLTADSRRLAIEIDGERYHRNWTGELCRGDQIRNQRLFELGYDVMRFWVYEVRDDLAGCVLRVVRWTEARIGSGVPVTAR